MAERAIEVAASLIDLARIEAKIPPSAPRVRFSLFQVKEEIKF